eukprot:2602312-Prorocentrum_lima.AAC.1
MRGTMREPRHNPCCDDDFRVNKHPDAQSARLLGSPEGRRVASFWEEGTTLAHLDEAGVDLDAF